MSFCTPQLHSQTSGQRVQVCELLGRPICITGITCFFLGPILTPRPWQARAKREGIKYSALVYAAFHFQVFHNSSSTPLPSLAFLLMEREGDFFSGSLVILSDGGNISGFKHSPAGSVLRACPKPWITAVWGCCTSHNTFCSLPMCHRARFVLCCIPGAVQGETVAESH